MEYEYSNLINDINNWAKYAENMQWIDKQQALKLCNQEQGTANELFINDNARPLVVAFLGGTGVGKSSLLNKLAGRNIAKTGIKRPTSCEVTLYHHSSANLNQLREIFPLQKIQVEQHTEAANKQIIWIDMPDIDSTEKTNQDIVMQWLPYIDVLIYVVSPERYKDNKVWQLLLAKKANHAWLFVMNQWDNGKIPQYTDFQQQLDRAGFHDPILYKTTCLEETIQQDEFDKLQMAVQSIATKKIVKQLELRGLQLRLNCYKKNLQQCLLSLGSEMIFAELLEQQKHSWLQTKNTVYMGLEWSLKQISLTYTKATKVIKSNKIELWDDWAQNRLDDYLSSIVLSADKNSLPSTTLKKSFVNISDKAKKIINTQVELGLRQSLVNSGNAVQRTLLKLSAICTFILPLTAMCIVSFQVFQGFYNSSITNQPFLGINFVVHSLLLILLCWLVPFFMLKNLQPSAEKSALKGLKNGLLVALKTIEIEVKQEIDSQKIQHQKIIQSLQKLIKVCDMQNAKIILASKNNTLKRILVEN